MSLMAVSNTVKVDGRFPLQAHLTLTGQPSEMRLQWVTEAQGDSVEHVVEWGESPDKLWFAARAESYQYTKQDLARCQRQSYAQTYWHDPGQIHDVVMTNLQPDRQYFYRYGTQPPYQSTVKSFRSARLPGQPPHTRLLAFGDMGTGTGCTENLGGWCETGAQQTLDGLYRQVMGRPVGHYDALLHFGDISYAVGFALRWDQFFHDVQPLADQLPYMTTIGNHEYDHTNQPFRPFLSNYGNDSHGECGLPYSYRFQMPGPARRDFASQTPWWSLDIGLVHVIAFSFEHNFTTGSQQLVWAQHDLQQVDRRRTPFVVALGHRELYSSMIDKADWIVGMYLTRYVEPVLVQHKVDLMMVGHVHNYERTCPLVQGRCDPDRGVVNVVAGMAGMGLDPFPSSDPPHSPSSDTHSPSASSDPPQSFSASSDPPQSLSASSDPPQSFSSPSSSQPDQRRPAWSLFRNSNVYGFTTIEVTRTQLLLSFIDAATNKLVDQVTIKPKK